jgi:hypothetical protein
MKSRPRPDKNAPGAFYITGERLACGIPEGEAPILFAPLGADNYLDSLLDRAAGIAALPWSSPWCHLRLLDHLVGEVD